MEGRGYIRHTLRNPTSRRGRGRGRGGGRERRQENCQISSAIYILENFNDFSPFSSLSRLEIITENLSLFAVTGELQISIKVDVMNNYNRLEFRTEMKSYRTEVICPSL